MNSKLKLTNRVTAEDRVVSLAVWDLMQKDGRSKYWTPIPFSKPEKIEKMVKEKVTKIEPIKIISETKKEKVTKTKPIKWEPLNESIILETKEEETNE